MHTLRAITSLLSPLTLIFHLSLLSISTTIQRLTCSTTTTTTMPLLNSVPPTLTITITMPLLHHQAAPLCPSHTNATITTIAVPFSAPSTLLLFSPASYCSTLYLPNPVITHYTYYITSTFTILHANRKKKKNITILS